MEDADGETALPSPAVAVACLVSAALLIVLHRRTNRAKTHQPKVIVMTPVNEYSWDGEGSDGERAGTNSTLPLLQRKA